MPFRLTRDGGAVFFRSWAEYMRARAPGGNRSLARVLAVNNRDFAKAERDQSQRALATLEATLEHEQGSGSESSRTADNVAKARERHRLARQRAGLAWLTPVLGSGCLDAGSDADRARTQSELARVIRAASAIARDNALLSDGTPVGVAVERFIGDLATSRGYTPVELEPGAIEGRHAIAAHAALCACLMTRLHVACLNYLPGPLPDALDPVPVPGGPAPAARAVSYRRLEVLAALERFSAALSDDDRSFIDGLVEQVRQSLAEKGRDWVPVSRAADVGVLTDLAWHLMVRGTAQYSGWRDLFTALSIRTESADREMRSPCVQDVTDVGGWLFEELQAITEASWASRRGGEASPRTEFYDATAAMLARQAVLNGLRATDSRDKFPRAAGFVTGFDIELEHALLAAGEKFYIIAPFRYIADGRFSGLIWLQARVDIPSVDESALDRLRATTNWAVVDPSRHPLDEGIPVVVRLSGAPLAGVPDLAVDTALGETLRHRLLGHRLLAHDPTATRVEHALVIDEHTGLHQWSADLRMRGSEGDGLPDELVHGSDWVPRFWALLGVQIRDHAIRHRVAATISANALRSTDADGASVRRAGVAVIRHSSPGDREVLHWRGIDVVQSDFSELTAEINDYAARLAHPDRWSELEGTR